MTSYDLRGRGGYETDGNNLSMPGSAGRAGPDKPVSGPAKSEPAKVTGDSKTVPSSTADVTPPEGETTIDEHVTAEVEMLSYEAVDLIVREIGTRIGGLESKPRAIVLCGDEVQSDLDRLGVFLALTARLERAYLPLDEGPREAISLAPITALVVSAVEFLSLFRQDTKYFGRKVAIDADALAAHLARRLAENKIEVYRSDAIGQQHGGGRAILEALEKVDAARRRSLEMYDGMLARLVRVGAEARRLEEKAKQIVDHVTWLQTYAGSLAGDAAEHVRQDIERHRFTTIPEASGSAVAAVMQYEYEKGRSDRHQRAIEAADAAYTALRETLVADTGTGQSALEQLVRASDLQAMLRAGDTFLLDAEVVMAGGSYRTRKNLFTTLFSGDLLRYSGGAVVAFLLRDAAGKVVAADAIRHMSGFCKFDRYTSAGAVNNFLPA